jgi:hypothetical protein
LVFARSPSLHLAPTSPHQTRASNSNYRRVGAHAGGDAAVSCSFACGQGELQRRSQRWGCRGSSPPYRWLRHGAPPRAPSSIFVKKGGRRRWGRGRKSKKGGREPLLHAESSSATELQASASGTGAASAAASKYSKDLHQPFVFAFTRFMCS